jgi:hypothetical protein
MIGKLAMVMALGASAAWAGGVPVETGKLDGAKIALHVYPFLDATELATLRLVLTNSQALQLFLPDHKGFAALAVAPDEGFIRKGVPVASASALSGLPDAKAAAAKALATCDAARAKSGQACVLVLELGPA